MSKITFDEFVLKDTLRGKCKTCGKRCQQTVKTWETKNPFNMNSSGQPKTWDEIRESVFLKHEQRKTEGVECSNCEYERIWG